MDDGRGLPWVIARAFRRNPRAYWVARRVFTATNHLLPPVAVGGVPGPVHRNDLMLDRSSEISRASYLTGALEAVGLVEDALEAMGGTLSDADVLDFGCGYGRIVRHFATAARSISACDLDHRAVRFCARHLGATPVPGDPDLSRVALDHYDAIWLGSVITHHPAEVCGPLLRTLADHVRPGGVLVFTSTNERALPHYVAAMDWIADHVDAIRRDLKARGVAYVAYPQNRDDSYGLGFQTPAWLDGVLEGSGLVRLWHRPDVWGIQDATAWGRPSS